MLLKVALRAFAFNGFEGTNVKQLGHQAGIAPSLLYYHFKDKKGLWQAALLLESEELKHAMQLEELDGPLIDPIELLKKWMSAFIYFSAGHPEFHQVIAHEMTHQSPRADWLLEHILQPLHTDLRNRINAIQKAGLIKTMPMANFVSIAIGAANVFFNQGYQMKKLYDVDVFEESEINGHIETVLELFFHGILTENNPG